MHLENKEFLHDKRIVERHIAQGFLTREQAEAARAALPDLADQAETTSIELEHVPFRISVPGARRVDEPRRPLDEELE